MHRPLPGLRDGPTTILDLYKEVDSAVEGKGKNSRTCASKRNENYEFDRKPEMENPQTENVDFWGCSSDIRAIRCVNRARMRFSFAGAA
jgi:hypothetical protein